MYLAKRIEGTNETLVALKKIREANHGSGAFDVLAREAKLASRVDHPNVVATLDVERIGAHRVMIMQYVEGASLREVMSRGPVPARLVSRIMHDACKGLGAIHAACDTEGNRLELVHRDVSPENILVGIDGITRIADFGIALSNNCTRHTLRSARRGKPAYMAPEYLTDGVATPSTDLYSLAVVAWESLTGEPLFQDTDTVEANVAMRRQLVLAPSAFVDDVPVGWDTLLLRALGCASQPRFDEADALECAIVQAAAGQIASRPEVARFVLRTTSAPSADESHVSLTQPGHPAAKRLARTG